MKLLAVFFTIVQILRLSLGATVPCDTCSGKLELGIVLDSSSSISRDDFSKGQAFLQSYLKNFQIGPDSVRVSIITYGLTIHPEDSFNLTTYNTGDEVREAIGLIPHRATTYTATGDAIRFMRQNQLAPHLTRAGVPKVGVVITDGNSQNTKLTASEAERARNQGIELWAIGVGNQIDNLELLNIAGDNDRVDRVDSYDKLVTITDWLAKQTCVGGNSQ